MPTKQSHYKGIADCFTPDNGDGNDEKNKMESGILLLDKPSGWTSHDAVALIRKKLGVRRIGHAGTLDPAATGLLVLLVGTATKKQAEFQKAAKVYGGVIRFGAETDTWDAAGKIISEKPVPPISSQDIDAMLSELTGEITQPVPAYCAVKFHGVPMYALARRGAPLPENVRKVVSIHGWRDIIWQSPELSFRVECSGGTYIRSIAQVLGQKAGCGAHLKTLRRLAAGDFSVDGALSAEAAKEMSKEEIQSRVI